MILPEISDADMYIEHLLRKVDDPDYYPLTRHDWQLVLMARLAYARLMLALAVRLEAK